MDNYIFLHFKDLNKQQQYIRKNLNRILDLLTICFPIQNPINHIVSQTIYKDIINSELDNQWYFVLNTNQLIIGLCYIHKELQCTHVTEKDLIDQFEFYNINNLTGWPVRIYQQNTTIGPEISTLCKDPNYKNVGRFLLDNILKDLKNTYRTVYLVPESIYYKDNYGVFVLHDYCHFPEGVIKYNEANKKLIKYYQSVGFEIMSDLFIFERCNREDRNYNILNIMYMDL